MNSFTRQKMLIPYLGEPLLSDYQDIAGELKRSGASATIDKVNWQEYPFQPKVQIHAGYSKVYLWLLYEVKGDYFRAISTVDQQPVWQDSCVEFFVSRDIDINAENQTDIVYQNFEFNSLGICLSASGTKSNRESLRQDQLKQILRFPGIKKQKMPVERDPFDWELLVAIPLDLIGLMPGKVFRANFYKCGDLTRKPHYLSWSSILSTEPDFHLPFFFGEIELLS
ncbi:MAG: carbohydrate-binding family 9-like protein [Prolixibacteraceae bacterium]